MTIDRKKLMALRKAEREKKHRPKSGEKEFTSKKLGKFFLYRNTENPSVIQIHMSGLSSLLTVGMTVETILEQCEYMPGAPPIRLSRNEFAKLEKYLTPLPPNVTVM